MRRLIPLSLVLAGCLPGHSGVPAPSDALACAEAATVGMGYLIVARSPTSGFTAQRTIPGADIFQIVAEIETAFWGDGSGEYRLAVNGNRYEVRRRQTPPNIGDGTVIPQPGVVQVGTSNRGRHRISPGPVAADAASIREMCGSPDPSLRVAG